MNNSTLLNKFEFYLDNKKKLSKNTIRSYILDINKISTFLGEEYIADFTVSEQAVEKYILQLKKEEYSSSTLLRIISSINMFNNFLYAEKIIAYNIKVDIKIKKSKVESELVVFTREEINNILNFKEDDFLSIRDKAIFELVYAIGIKPTDCINLLLVDINLNIGYLKYKNAKNISQTIPLNKETISALKKYVDYLVDNCVNTKYLFVSANGEQLTRQGFWKIFKRRQQELNLTKDLSPTTYRNSLAIHLLEDGIALEDVRELLGLKSIHSLKNYLDNINKDNSIKRVLVKHPRNSME